MPRELPLDPEWRARAQCAGEYPEIFFSEGTSHTDRENTRHARAICRDCPVIKECLLEALKNGEKFGVWGGLTADERQSRQLGFRSDAFPRDALRRYVNERLARR